MSFSASEINAMRSVANQTLWGTAVIQTEGFTDDGGGGGSVSWSVAGTVSARLAPLTGSEREIADRIASDASYLITLPAETSITVKDRVVMGGGTFNVMAIRKRTSEITRQVEAGESV